MSRPAGSDPGDVLSIAHILYKLDAGQEHELTLVNPFGLEHYGCEGSQGFHREKASIQIVSAERQGE